MLYCPSCNNTHWTPTKNFRVLAFLRFKRELKCGKCSKIRLGSIFMDTGPPKDRRIHCPECNAIAARSRRKGWERLLLFMRAYRCQKCKCRFHQFRVMD